MPANTGFRRSTWRSSSDPNFDRIWHGASIAIAEWSLDLVNLRTGIEFHNWGVYLWGKNLTNERYYEDYNPAKYTGLPYDIGSLAEPLTYGIEIKAHF
jgi:iron complex outermembrane recepter protein